MGQDDFGNAGTVTYRFQVYQGNLPPLPPPRGFHPPKRCLWVPSGSLRSAVEGAQSYSLACGPSSNAVAAFGGTKSLSLSRIRLPPLPTGMPPLRSIPRTARLRPVSVVYGSLLWSPTREASAPAGTDVLGGRAGGRPGLEQHRSETVTFRVYGQPSRSTRCTVSTPTHERSRSPAPRTTAPLTGRLGMR
jgi:hypothetical protein